LELELRLSLGFQRGEQSLLLTRIAMKVNALLCLLLFNGHFGRLNYRKNVIAFFEVHSLD
jgi:hypothetical protein